MDWVVFPVVLPLFLWCGLRGRAFHNYLVEQAGETLKREGFEVMAEHPLRLPDGRYDFTDLWAQRGPVELLCEIETSPRNASSNIGNARALGLPLIVIVPDRKTRDAIHRRALRAFGPGYLRQVWISLPDAMPQALRSLFSRFSRGE